MIDRNNGDIRKGGIMRYAIRDGEGWKYLQVLTYPMGDASIKDPGLPQGEDVALEVDFPVNWELVYQFRELVTGAFYLFIPYLPNGRADKDVPNAAKATARLAAGVGADVLVTADPHSGEWLTEYRRASGKFTSELHVRKLIPSGEYDAVIAPDKGARLRAGRVASQLGVPLVTASKRRDPATGRLSDYHVDADLTGMTCLVVDDICDGGGTFALLAEAAPNAVLDLFVTHGGFTKPESPVFGAYRKIMTTDAYPGRLDLADEVFQLDDLFFGVFTTH